MIADDSRATAVIEASAVVRAADLVTARVRTARASSRLAALASSAVASWAALTWSSRRLAVGLMLIVAPVVHVMLSLSSPSAQPGWIWLVIPGLSAVIGVLLVAGSGVFGAGETSR